MLCFPTKAVIVTIYFYNSQAPRSDQNFPRPPHLCQRRDDAALRGNPMRLAPPPLRRKALPPHVPIGRAQGVAARPPQAS